MRQDNLWKTWGHFLGLFSCFLVGATIGTLPRIMYGFQDEPGWMVFFSEMVRIVATVTALLLYAKHILRNDFNSLLLNTDHFHPVKWALVGIALPVLMILIFWVTTGLEISFGLLPPSAIIDGLLKSLGMALAAGITEELVFRGYLVAILKIRYKTLVAALTPSLLFILLHIGGVESISGAMQLFVAGLAVSIMFLVIRYHSGSVWNASMVHFIWNFIVLNELITFGADINSNTFINLDYGSRSIFTGGEFGIEASIPAILLYSATALLAWKLIKDKGQKNWGAELFPLNNLRSTT